MGKLPMLQDSTSHQTKKLDINIEITSGTDCNSWVSAGGEGVDRVQLIMDLGIVYKLYTQRMLPTQFGAYHDGSWGELLGDTIFDGKHIQPKDAKVYKIHNNQLVHKIEWQVTCHCHQSLFHIEN